MIHILCFKILCVPQTQLETAPPHELKNIFQMLQELLVSDTLTFGSICLISIIISFTNIS